MQPALGPYQSQEGVLLYCQPEPFTVFNMVWRTHVVQMPVFIMPVRGLNGTIFNTVWRTHVLQMAFL